MVKRHTVKKRKLHGYKYLGGVRFDRVERVEGIERATAAAAEAKSIRQKSASDAALARRSETQIAELRQKAAKARTKAEKQRFEREAQKLRDRVLALERAERGKTEKIEEKVSSERDIQQAREKLEIDKEIRRKIEEQRAKQAHVKGKVRLTEKVSVKEALKNSGVKELKEAPKDVQQVQKGKLQEIALKEAKGRATEQARVLEVQRKQVIKDILEAKVQRSSEVMREVRHERVMETSRQGQQILGEAQKNIRSDAIETTRNFSDVKRSAETARAEAKTQAEITNGTLHDLTTREYTQTGDKSVISEQLKDATKRRNATDTQIKDVKTQIESANKDITSAVDSAVGLRESVEGLNKMMAEKASARDAALKEANTFRDVEPGKIDSRVQEIRDGQSGFTERADAVSRSIESTRGEQALNQSRTSGLKERLDGSKAEAAKAEAGSVQAFGKEVEGTREAATAADGKYGEIAESIGTFRDGIKDTARDPALDSRVDGARADIPQKVETAPPILGKLAIEGVKLEGIKTQIEAVPLKADIGKLETAKNTFEDLSRPGGPADTAARQAEVKNDITEVGKNHENTTGAKDVMDLAERAGMPKEPAKGDLTRAEGAAKTASEAANSLREGINKSTTGRKDAENANIDLQTTLRDGTATEMKDGFKDAMERAKSARKEVSKSEPVEKPSIEALKDKQGGEKSAKEALEQAKAEVNRLEEIDPVKELPDNIPDSLRTEMEAREAQARQEATRSELERTRSEAERLKEKTEKEETARAEAEGKMKDAEKVAKEAKDAAEAARAEATRLEEARRVEAEKDAARQQQIEKLAKEALEAKEVARAKEEALKREQAAKEAKESR